MKIPITGERECCDPKLDLKPVEGTPSARGGYPRFKFCVHCGAYWEAHRETDAAGGYDTEYRRCRPPWDPAVAVVAAVAESMKPQPELRIPRGGVRCSRCSGLCIVEDPQHGHALNCSQCHGKGWL
jgi:hypothetical protein